MIKQDLIERSPVRFFEQTIDGGLKAGEFGVLTSKKGLGKTAVLVQIALDMLLQDKQIVHVSFNQNASYVITWYEDLFAEMAKKKNLADADAVKAELICKRVILNLHQDKDAFSRVAKTLKALVEGDINTSCVIIDGLSLKDVSAADANVLKAYAKEAGIVIWASSDCDAEDVVSGLDKEVVDIIDVVCQLKQTADVIDMKVLKARSNGELETHLKLDTKTLLIAEK